MTIVFVKQSNKNYMFEAPENINLNKGDHVLCDTVRGITDGVCIASSIAVGDDETLAAIAAVAGASLPLKRIVGRYEIERFEYNEEDKA